jgi:RecA/RadA recombinase
MDAAMEAAPPVPPPIMLRPEALLHTGSTLLNLAATDMPHGGYLKGTYVFIVGDSASGKTFLSMTCFAESTLNDAFGEYDLIFDNAERGNLFDTDKMFNERVTERMRAPAYTKTKEPIFSATIEQFYFHLDDAFKRGRPFIYVLDSMDVLTSDADDKKFDEQKKAYAKKRGAAEGGEDKGKAPKGSFGMSKAKKNSEYMRKAVALLEKTNSILIVISQTRDDTQALWGGKTRGGGHALRFYAHLEYWASIIETIKKEVHGIKRKIGNRVKLSMRKNRLTGKLRDVEVLIYPTSGLDDVGSCVDYLVTEGWWPAKDGLINATEVELTGHRETIIKKIEVDGLEPQLHEAVAACWAAVETALAVTRKNKYA